MHEQQETVRDVDGQAIRVGDEVVCVDKTAYETLLEVGGQYGVIGVERHHVYRDLDLLTVAGGERITAFSSRFRVVQKKAPKDAVKDADGSPIEVGDEVENSAGVRRVVDRLGSDYCGEMIVTYTSGGWDPANHVRKVYRTDSAPTKTVVDVHESGPVKTTTTYKPGKVEDFSGTIDGAGVKSVMANPKCPLDLIPPQFSEGVAEVLKHGAQKYAPGNWMRGMSWETVLGGVQRHIQAFRRGEEIDPESGLPHLHHAACGLMFASWFAHGPQAEQHRRFDDRKFKQQEVV